MTLIEAMVVVTVMSLIVGVALSLLVSLRNWDRTARDRNARNDQLIRLAEMLRTDIREAREVSMPSERTLLIEQPDNQRIEYELGDSGSCRRTKRQGESAEPIVDSFTVGPASAWALDRNDAGAQPSLAILIARPSQTERLPAPLLVRATLAADLAPTAN